MGLVDGSSSVSSNSNNVDGFQNTSRKSNDSTSTGVKELASKNLKKMEEGSSESLKNRDVVVEKSNISELEDNYKRNSLCYSVLKIAIFGLIKKLNEGSPAVIKEIIEKNQEILKFERILEQIEQKYYALLIQWPEKKLGIVPFMKIELPPDLSKQFQSAIYAFEDEGLLGEVNFSYKYIQERNSTIDSLKKTVIEKGEAQEEIIQFKKGLDSTEFTELVNDACDIYKIFRSMLSEDDPLFEVHWENYENFSRLQKLLENP